MKVTVLTNEVTKLQLIDTGPSRALLFNGDHPAAGELATKHIGGSHTKHDPGRASPSGTCVHQNPSI